MGTAIVRGRPTIGPPPQSSRSWADFHRPGAGAWLWYGSDFCRESVSQTGFDDFVGTRAFTSVATAFLLGVNRIRSARPFGRREVRLHRLCVAELMPLHGTRLATGAAPSLSTLTPRLRQVLLCLFDGDGEKQIAARLGISRHTVHEYLRSLHRRFDVRSRGELLARSVPLLPLLLASESNDVERP